MKCTVAAETAPAAAAQRRREVQLYLGKLRRLLPAARAPRRRRLSRLQVIHHVIDYICDLQHALLRHPATAHAHVPCAPPTPPATPVSDDRLQDDDDLCTACSRQSSCSEEEMGPES